jgi:hypothetical protein
MEQDLDQISLNEINEKVIKELKGNYTYFDILNEIFIEQLEIFPIHTYFKSISYDTYTSSLFLPEKFNIKNHLDRILIYFKKDYLYNCIIIGKLIEFDIYIYIVRHVDYEEQQQYTSILFYTYSLEELVYNFIKYETKIQLLEISINSKNNLEDLFSGLKVNENCDINML